MTKVLSRKSRGADDRDVERAEARRSGKRLGEWLNNPGEEAESDRRAIRALGHLAEMLERSREAERRRRSEEDEDSVAARLERLESRLADPDRAIDVKETLGAVERRLEELSRRFGPRAGRETAESDVRPVASIETPATRARFDSLSQQLAAARREADARAQQQTEATRQVEGLRRDIEQMSRAIGDLAPRASVAAIETAIADLMRRIDAQRTHGAEDALLAPAARIVGELRAVMEDLDPSAIVRNLHADVQTIGRRLDALQTQIPADAATLRRLAAETGDIRAQLATLAALPLPLEKIETRLTDLTRRVDALARAGEGASKALLAFDIDELTRSIRAIVAEETGANLNAFNRQLEQLAGKLDEVVAQAGGARFDELGRRIDALDRSLSERIEASAARKSVDAGALEELLTGLAQKIDHALDGSAQTESFERISRKIERLETRPAIDELGERMKRLESRLADGSGAETIARIEAMLLRPAEDKRLSELVQRIDGLRETLAERAGAAGVRPLEELVRNLDRKIETALVGGVRSGDLEAIRNQLDDLSLKVDRLEEPRAKPHPQFDDIADRLERMQSSMAERAERETRAVARQEELAGLVSKLADRLNAAAANAEPETLKALEQQIGALSQRLDRRDPNSAALAAVEVKIGALVEQMESARSAAAHAAEEAVRKATQDILHKANPVPGALRETLARELSDIRADQGATAQRTQQTLEAVHETLERVVARLATFEDEFAEFRASVKTPEAEAPQFVRSEAPEAADFVMSAASRPAERREPSFASGSAQEHLARPAETGPMDFIAAARRAAQQAAADADAADKALHANRAAQQEEQLEEDAVAYDDQDRASRLGAAIQERKRPLLLGLGALILMLGAYQIARTGSDHTENAPERTAPAGKEAPAAPAPSVAPPAAGASKSSGPATPPRIITPRADSAPVDHLPVGSISAAPAAAPALDASTIIKARAELGDPGAQYEYGVRLLEGRGYARDPKLAAQWFEKAAAQGLAPAQYRLGSMYEKGVGLERDFARARQLYRTAADAGNARAMHNLAVLYAEGGEEGRPDYPAAAEWFGKAAEYGLRDSQYNLAILYARGLGVGQNLVQSYVWFAAAAAQGDADAAKKRDDVGARLDSKDLASAEARASSFRAKTPLPAANDVEPPTGGWENAAPGANVPSPLPVPNSGAKATKPKISSL